MSNAAQRSFGRGELAPSLYGRTDQVAYATGLRTCRNLQVMKSGGAESRPGTVLVGQVPANSLARLIPFVFNDTQAYTLEFSNGLVRFIRDGGYVGGVAPYSVAVPYLASELAAIRYVQSADVLTLVHPNHPPAELQRHADANWSYVVSTFAPAIGPPSGVAMVPPSTGTFVQYVVTAVDAVTAQESFASAPVGFELSGLEALTMVNPLERSIVWNAVAGASAYNIYKSTTNNGDVTTDFGFIGSAGTLTFFDNGIVADLENRAPIARNPFTGTGNYPSAVGYFQGRLLFGGSLNNPQTIWTSRSADTNNFTVSSPSQDDDALTFTLAGKTVATIQHFVTPDTLLPFTLGGEWIVTGDASGILRPTDFNAKNYAKHGCSLLPPIEIDSRILYVQARQAIVRDLKRDFYYGYLGNDLTVMSTHLFKGHQLVDWAYQENPESIVWCVREDGVLLGLTDVAEQQMDAWHRHDTLGRFENVCVIPEGGLDAVYVVVNRRGVRYTERFTSRFFTDVQDCICMDAALSYDGRNTDATKTMTLSAGADWTYDESLTLTCSTSEFISGDVGNAIALTGGDGTVIRLRITGVASATVVTGFPQKTVPASMRGVPTATWARAVDQVAGLGHLEGQAVSVFADGLVVASPNNPQAPTIVVTGGIATLDMPYGYIHVGLPYVSDLETLGIDTPEGPSLKEKKALINRLTMVVDQSRGVFAGPKPPPSDASVDGLVEFKQRDREDWDAPVALRSGVITINVLGGWRTDGHVFIRQVDPIPLTILGIVPTGNIPPA